MEFLNHVSENHSGLNRIINIFYTDNKSKMAGKRIILASLLRKKTKNAADEPLPPVKLTFCRGIAIVSTHKNGSSPTAFTRCGRAAESLHAACGH